MALGASATYSLCPSRHLAQEYTYLAAGSYSGLEHISSSHSCGVWIHSDRQGTLGARAGPASGLSRLAARCRYPIWLPALHGVRSCARADGTRRLLQSLQLVKGLVDVCSGQADYPAADIVFVRWICNDQA